MKKKKERHRIKMGPWSLKLSLKKHLEKKQQQQQQQKTKSNGKCGNYHGPLSQEWIHG